MATQLPIAFFNGAFTPLSEVRVSPLDRGFLFGEGVYEVIAVYAGRVRRLQAHLARLKHSLCDIALPCPMSDAELRDMLQQLVEANGGGDLSIYLQLTRGVSSEVRNHVFPAASTPTVFAMCQTLDARDPAIARDGVAAITLPDQRWSRCDIKSTSLLANTLAREYARTAGASEAILVRDKQITEGAASTVFVVRDGVVTQPPPNPSILPGTTADLVHELLAECGVPARRSAITLNELRAADEIWLASTTRELLPVTTLDNQPVGSGRPGPLWQQIDAAYQVAKTAAPHAQSSA